tara:strand:+ start:7711 stop:9030 length:1320 start_codon:yes stop_codon:yes gene_type:complete
MLKNNGHIDKMFSDGLKNLSVQPRPELWGNINASVKLARRKKRAAVIFISLAAAASLALLFTISNTAIFKTDNRINNVELISETKSNQVEAKSELANEKMYTTNKKNAKSVNETNQVSKKHDKELLALNNTNTSELFSERKIIIQMVMPEMQVTKLDNYSLGMRLFEKRIGDDNLANLSRLKDSLIIVRNLRLLDQFDESNKKNKEWSVLGQFSSAYSSYNGDKSGNNSEDGLISIGGGVKLNWQAGKKLAIQTGIIYNKFGQQLAGRNSARENAAFMTDIGLRDNVSTSIETSAGNIKMKEEPRLYDSNEFLSARVSSSSSPDMVQSFEAIEIPFILRYSLIDKKFGLHMSGGLSTNLMIGNRVYDKSTRETLGETSGIRSTNFSTSFSLGLEYKLNSKFSLSMEPAFKYYLNSINKDSDFNYKPYSIGLSSGIRYKF